MTQAVATIVGLKDFPNITEVNVRTGPGTNYENPFKIAVGVPHLAILDVQADNEGKHLNQKVYQWFQLRFPDNSVGWVRDDLIDVEGDLSAWGYGVLTTRVAAFSLTRGAFISAPPSPATPAQPSAYRAEQEAERVRKAAFDITATFEGGSYKAYNNYDAGIVSYGLFQFTLAASSLQSVLEIYLNTAHSDVANKLRGYLPRVMGKDAALRHDMEFKNLLLAAGDDPAMQQAQIQVGTEKYWNAVYNGYIAPRGLQTPLAWALLFDMGINFGTGHGFVRLAEQQLGVPPRSRPGENGITEQQLITHVAQLRKESHDRQAVRDNLPGLRARGDFWVHLVQMNDWGLGGDVNGFVNVNGRLIQVRNPQ